MQEVVDEATAEETNEYTQRRQTSIHRESTSTTRTTLVEGKQQSLHIQSSEIVGKQQQKSCTEGTQQELRGETENRRWSEREQERKREIGNRYVFDF